MDSANRPDWDRFMVEARADPESIGFEVIKHIAEVFPNEMRPPALQELSDEEQYDLLADFEDRICEVTVRWVVGMSPGYMKCAICNEIAADPPLCAVCVEEGAVPGCLCRRSCSECADEDVGRPWAVAGPLGDVHWYGTGSENENPPSSDSFFRYGV